MEIPTQTEKMLDFDFFQDHPFMGLSGSLFYADFYAII
jgi:hypothetical protein